VLDGSAEAKLREAAEGDPYELRLRELRLAKPWMDMLASGTRLVVDFEEWIKKPGCTLAVRLPHRLVGRLIPACRSCCARGQLGAVRLLTTLPARRAPITANARRPGPHVRPKAWTPPMNQSRGATYLPARLLHSPSGHQPRR
jgi:hypothetical protein